MKLGGVDELIELSRVWVFNTVDSKLLLYASGECRMAVKHLFRGAIFGRHYKWHALYRIESNTPTAPDSVNIICFRTNIHPQRTITMVFETENGSHITLTHH